MSGLHYRRKLALIFFLLYERRILQSGHPVNEAIAALYFIRDFFSYEFEGRVGAKSEHLNGPAKGLCTCVTRLRTFHPWVSSDLRTWHWTLPLDCRVPHPSENPVFHTHVSPDRTGSGTKRPVGTCRYTNLWPRILASSFFQFRFLLPWPSFPLASWERERERERCLVRFWEIFNIIFNINLQFCTIMRYYFRSVVKWMKFYSGVELYFGRSSRNGEDLG